MSAAHVHLHRCPIGEYTSTDIQALIGIAIRVDGSCKSVRRGWESTTRAESVRGISYSLDMETVLVQNTYVTLYPISVPGQAYTGGLGGVEDGGGKRVGGCWKTERHALLSHMSGAQKPLFYGYPVSLVQQENQSQMDTYERALRLNADTSVEPGRVYDDIVVIILC